MGSEMCIRDSDEGDGQQKEQMVRPQEGMANTAYKTGPSGELAAVTHSERVVSEGGASEKKQRNDSEGSPLDRPLAALD